MILETLDIRSFRCISHLRVDLTDGLNVLYGPNELGKSTLVEALRAAFLLPVNSKVAEEFVPWGTDETPQVTVEFELPERGQQDCAQSQRRSTRWRIKKSFGSGSAGSAVLERITGHGRTVEEARGRDVEGRLRALLDWGILEPGGRRAPRGWPQSYLITALLGEQDGVAKIFDTSLDSDGTDSGRNHLTAALGVLAQAPEVTALLDRLNLRVGEVFTDRGQKRRTQDSPLVRITDQKRKQQEKVAELEDENCKCREIEETISELKREQQRAETRARNLNREVNLLTEVIRQRDLVNDCRDRQAALKKAEGDYRKADEDHRIKCDQRDKIQSELQDAETALGQVKETVAGHEARRKQLADSRSESLESRHSQLEAHRSAAEQQVGHAQRAIDAATEVEQKRDEVAKATDILKDASVNLNRAEGRLWQALKGKIGKAEQQVAYAEAVVSLAKLIEERDQLTAVVSAREEYKRLSGIAKRTEEQLDKLKTRRTILQKARDDSLDSAKLKWQKQQQQTAHRNQLDDDLRRADAAETRARDYLNQIDRFDEVSRRLVETKQKQSDLSADHEAAEQELSHRTDELDSLARSASLRQMAAIGCAAAVFLTLILAIVIPTGRVFLLSGSGVLSVAFIVLALCCWRFAIHRREVNAKRDDARHWLDRLTSLALITDSELAAAQRDFDSCQRRLPVELRDRFDDLTEARLWLEQKLSHAADKRSRLEKKTAELHQNETESRPENDPDDPTETLDAQIQELDGRIAAADLEARTSCTQRDQALARYEQMQNAASPSHGEGIAEDRISILDGDVADCIEQLNWSESDSIPGVENAMREASLARHELSAATSECDSKTELFTTKGHQNIELEASGEEPSVTSVEDAEQQLRLARSQLTDADEELKQRQADLKAKEETADRLSNDLERPADDVLKGANQALADIATQITNVDSGADNELESATTLRDDAREKESEHQAQVAELKGKLQQVDQALKELLEARATARTARDKSEENARQLDADSTNGELLRLKATLAREFPNLDVSVEQLEHSTRERDTAVQVQQQNNQLLHEARGKLELSGGEVLREQLEAAQTELERIEADAMEQELEYDALFHLQQTLQHAGRQHSAHLGKRLAQPVTEQFRALTDNRYMALQLDPDLQLKTVTSQNSERSQDAMSVGTRHQLATLFRLALAAHLQTAVVLDDQLVHSDTDRLLWFRDRLRQSIADNEFQAVVITCRPLDYISEQEFRSSSDLPDAFKTCNPVNLSDVIDN